MENFTTRIILKRFKKSMNGERWTLNSGRWMVEGGWWTLNGGRWTVDGGRWTVDGILFKSSGHKLVTEWSRYGHVNGRDIDKSKRNKRYTVIYLVINIRI